MFWFGGSVYATEEEVQSLVQGYMARRERQAAELLSDIRQKVAAQRLDGLINTVNKYLAEKPNDNEVLALRKSLVDRQDKLTKEVVSRYERATQFMQQCLFNDAAKELNLIPESVRTAEATGSLNKCRELESLRQAAFLELTKPDASSNANAIICCIGIEQVGICIAFYSYIKHSTDLVNHKIVRADNHLFGQCTSSCSFKVKLALFSS